jgi:hypothetical protein
MIDGYFYTFLAPYNITGGTIEPFEAQPGQTLYAGQFLITVNAKDYENPLFVVDSFTDYPVLTIVRYIDLFLFVFSRFFSHYSPCFFWFSCV